MMCDVYFQELYNQAYDEVAVIFASCPNFNDNYSEAAFNNNGIEWMRLLNEILSDYDDLLNDPKLVTFLGTQDKIRRVK